MSFIVAIDGPAGSGKGTLAKEISRLTDLVNIDTGATYRCVTLAAIQKGYTLEDSEKIVELLDEIDIKLEKIDGEDRFFLNGEDVSKKIRGTAPRQVKTENNKHELNGLSSEF